MYEVNKKEKKAKGINDRTFLREERYNKVNKIDLETDDEIKSIEREEERNCSKNKEEDINKNSEKIKFSKFNIKNTPLTLNFSNYPRYTIREESKKGLKKELSLSEELLIKKYLINDEPNSNDGIVKSYFEKEQPLKGSLQNNDIIFQENINSRGEVKFNQYDYDFLNKDKEKFPGEILLDYHSNNLLFGDVLNIKTDYPSKMNQSALEDKFKEGIKLKNLNLDETKIFKPLNYLPKGPKIDLGINIGKEDIIRENLYRKYNNLFTKENNSSFKNTSEKINEKNILNPENIYSDCRAESPEKKNSRAYNYLSDRNKSLESYIENNYNYIKSILPESHNNILHGTLFENVFIPRIDKVYNIWNEKSKIEFENNNNSSKIHSSFKKNMNENESLNIMSNRINDCQKYDNSDFKYRFKNNYPGYCNIINTNSFINDNSFFNCKDKQNQSNYQKEIIINKSPCDIYYGTKFNEIISDNFKIKNKNRISPERTYQINSSGKIIIEEGEKKGKEREGNKEKYKEKKQIIRKENKEVSPKKKRIVFFSRIREE